MTHVSVSGNPCSKPKTPNRSERPGEDRLQTFIASDGGRIAYDEEGSGRPLLMLHGLMANRQFFRQQAGLAPEFRVIAVDLRGHGDSTRPGAALGISQLADDVGELADHLGLQNAICLGWSLGASVLWHVMTGPASARFAGAVIVDMSPRLLNDDDWTLGLSREVCADRRRAIEEDFDGFAASAGAGIFAQPLDEVSRPLADWAAAEFARNDPETTGALWASLVAEDARPLLGRIAQPTLVIHGAQSNLYGSGTADHLAAALPNAKAIRFEQSGHAPHLEQPELFNRTIQEFAASLPRVREAPVTV